MRKSLVVAVVMLSIVGVMLVLSVDVDPPDDEHLVLDEGETPVEGNGYYTLVEALEAMEWPEDDAWIVSVSREQVTGDPEIQALLDRNRNAFVLMTRAATAPTFRVPPSADFDPPAFAAETRDLGQLVALDATMKLARHDENGAFERHLQYLSLVRRFQSTGELLHYLVGVRYKEDALAHILDSAANVDGGGLVAVADRLEDYAWDREAMENALRREYMFMTSVVAEPYDRADWSHVPLFGRYLYHENRTRALYAATFDRALESMNEDCSTAPRSEERREMSTWRYLGPNSTGRILHSVGVTDLSRYTYMRCREQMQLRLTRLALAARAYRADFGALPDSLGELVPRYLSELPLDIDGQSFRYSPADELVYSVGDDRRDDGGGAPTPRVDWDAPDPGVSLRR